VSACMGKKWSYGSDRNGDGDRGPVLGLLFQIQYKNLSTTVTAVVTEGQFKVFNFRISARVVEIHVEVQMHWKG